MEIPHFWGIYPHLSRMPLLYVYADFTFFLYTNYIKLYKRHTVWNISSTWHVIFGSQLWHRNGILMPFQVLSFPPPKMDKDCWTYSIVPITGARKPFQLHLFVKSPITLTSPATGFSLDYSQVSIYQYV